MHVFSDNSFCSSIVSGIIEFLMDSYCIHGFRLFFGGSYC